MQVAENQPGPQEISRRVLDVSYGRHDLGRADHLVGVRPAHPPPAFEVRLEGVVRALVEPRVADAQIMAEATAAGDARRDELSAQPGVGRAIGALVVLPARATSGNTPGAV